MKNCPFLAKVLVNYIFYYNWRYKMKRGYKFKHREYIRYFIFGIILAALAIGSLGIRSARPDTSEPVQCEPFNTGICEPTQIENCQPFYHPILRDCDVQRDCDGNVYYKLFDTLNATEVETSECERSNIYPECNPDRMSKDYIRECWKGGPPCMLDSANSKDNDTIKRKTDEE